MSTLLSASPPYIPSQRQPQAQTSSLSGDYESNTNGLNTSSIASSLPTVKVQTSFQKPSSALPIENKTPKQLAHNDIEFLQQRWYPKQIFNTQAPPQDQIANPIKFALLAFLVCVFMPLASIPVAIGACIWQTQRNQDSINKLFKNQANTIQVQTGPSQLSAASGLSAQVAGR